MENVQNHKDIDLGSLKLADEPVKVNSTVVVPFDPPLYVNTELMTATSPLTHEGKMLDYMSARATGGFLKFLRDFEEAVKDTAKRKSTSWWPKRNVTADLIDNGFKTYFKSQDVIKINTRHCTDAVFNSQHEQLSSDSVATGTRFWAVLVAKRVVLGKAEFGVVWALEQMLVKSPATCKVKAINEVVQDDDNEVFA